MGVRIIETMPIVDALADHIGADDELSQNRAAKAIGVSKTTMSQWIAGTVTPAPTPQRVQALSELLGMSTADVLRAFGFPVSDEVPGGSSVDGDTPRQPSEPDGATHNDGVIQLDERRASRSSRRSETPAKPGTVVDFPPRSATA